MIISSAAAAATIALLFKLWIRSVRNIDPLVAYRIIRSFVLALNLDKSIQIILQI